MPEKTATLKPDSESTNCLEHRQRRDAAIGDDERSLDAGAFEMIGDERARAGSEVNGGGKAES